MSRINNNAHQKYVLDQLVAIAHQPKKRWSPKATDLTAHWLWCLKRGDVTKLLVMADRAAELGCTVRYAKVKYTTGWGSYFINQIKYITADRATTANGVLITCPASNTYGCDL